MRCTAIRPPRGDSLPQMRRIGRHEEPAQPADEHILQRMPEADVRQQRPCRDGRVESGEDGVAPVAGQRVRVEHQCGEDDDGPWHRHIQRRRCGAVVDFRCAGERNLRIGHALLDRFQRARQIHGQQHDVESVDAQDVRPLISVAFQIGGHGQKVRQRRGHHPWAQQPLVERIGEQEHQTEARPCDRRHVVHAQAPLPQFHRAALRAPGFDDAEEFADDQQAAVRPAPPLHHQRAEIRRGRAVAQSFRIVHQMPAVVAQIHA